MLMQLIQSRWTAVVFGVLILSVAVLVTYRYTKAAYHAVGLNDGVIDSDTRTLERLTRIAGTIPICTDDQLNHGNLIVSVKAESIYARANGPGMISLCRGR